MNNTENEITLIRKIESFINTTVKYLIVQGNKVALEFSSIVSKVSKIRLEALGFYVQGNYAEISTHLYEVFENFKEKVSIRYNGISIKNLIFDKAANIIAKTEDDDEINCGKIEDYIEEK